MAAINDKLNKRSILFPKLKKLDQLKVNADQLTVKRDLAIHKSPLSVKTVKDFKGTLPKLNSSTQEDISTRLDNKFEDSDHCKTSESPSELCKKPLNVDKDDLNTGRHSFSGVHNRADYKHTHGLSRFNTSASLFDTGSEFLDRYLAGKHDSKSTAIENGQSVASENDVNSPGLVVISRERTLKDDSEFNPGYSLHRTVRDMPEKQSVEHIYGGYNCRLPHKLGSFERGRDSKIYKRTRHQSRSDRPFRKWPVGLELSGKCVTDDEIIEKDEIRSETGRPATEDGDSIFQDINTLPPLGLSYNGHASPRSSSKASFSASYYSDFGLRAQRSDLFSGHKRNRKLKSASEAEMEKEIEETARRHIYACQVISSVRNSSKAVRNLSSLRQTIGPAASRSTSHLDLTEPSHKPLHRPMTNSPDKFFHRLDSSQKTPPVAFFIKTRDSADVRRTRKADALPQIKGQTLVLGFVNK